MVVTVAVGLLGITLVVIILHAVAQREQRNMEADGRRFRALLERAGAPESAPDPTGPHADKVDVTNQSSPLGFVPVASKSEGVSHGSRGH